MENKPSPTRLLLVEDDEAFSEEFSAYLMQHSFEVYVSASINDAMKSISTYKPEVIVLDQFLNSLDSLSSIQQVRQLFSGGLMILTANTEPTDRIVGLELGADDYVSKLTSPREILARLRSLLRRHQETRGPAKASIPQSMMGQWRLDTVRRELFAPGGQLVPLTSGEFGALRYLYDHQGQPVSRDDLSRAVLHRRFDALDRSVDNLVSRLRKKFETVDPEFRALKTIRGEGYIFIGFDEGTGA